MLGAAADFIIRVISDGGYVGIVVLMALESCCTPLPSEIIMPFAGYLVSTGRFSLWAVATAGAMGCNFGSTVAYAIGYFGGRPLVERFGRYVLLDRRELDRVDWFFTRFGTLAIFVSRLLPGVRTFISLPAGIARMPMLPFQVGTFLGSWPFCYALAYVGMKLGEHWRDDPELRAVMHRFEGGIAVALVVAIGVFVWWRVRGVRRGA